ncbi:retrovirus-related pol polyprotein from transposon TNT 1-94 [Tanacetum coccineum]
MSRVMLDEQSIPQKFWCHALDTATYIFNRVYIRKFINKTPYEILRNKKPSLVYFKVFGCKVFIRNTKVHLTKFDQKSYEGVFLGYSQTSKGYIVLNKETIRIEESLNVTFDESLPEPNSSHLVEDDRINEPIVQDLNGSSSLQVNVSNEGYPKSVKEARGHPNRTSNWTYVKGMEVRQLCCFNEMKDRRQYIIQAMVDLISDSTC